MERLGESDVWGEVLIGVLSRDGWTVTDRPMLGGGHLVIAWRANLEIRHHGDTLTAATVPVFHACARARRLRAAA